MSLRVIVDVLCNTNRKFDLKSTGGHYGDDPPVSFNHRRRTMVCSLPKASSVSHHSPF